MKLKADNWDTNETTLWLQNTQSYYNDWYHSYKYNSTAIMLSQVNMFNDSTKRGIIRSFASWLKARYSESMRGVCNVSRIQWTHVACDLLEVNVNELYEVIE